MVLKTKNIGGEALCIVIKTYHMTRKPTTWSCDSLVCLIHDIDILNITMIAYDSHTPLGAGTHDVVHWRNGPKWYTGSCSLMTMAIFLSVYCLCDFVGWFDFIPINFTFVHQFLPMDSENDLCFYLCLIDSHIC